VLDPFEIDPNASNASRTEHPKLFAVYWGTFRGDPHEIIENRNSFVRDFAIKKLLSKHIVPESDIRMLEGLHLWDHVETYKDADGKFVVLMSPSHHELAADMLPPGIRLVPYRLYSENATSYVMVTDGRQLWQCAGDPRLFQNVPSCRTLCFTSDMVNDLNQFAVRREIQRGMSPQRLQPEWSASQWEGNRPVKVRLLEERMRCTLEWFHNLKRECVVVWTPTEMPENLDGWVVEKCRFAWNRKCLVRVVSKPNSMPKNHDQNGGEI
jgi:hypothetical protein